MTILYLAALYAYLLGVCCILHRKPLCWHRLGVLERAAWALTDLLLYPIVWALRVVVFAAAGVKDRFVGGGS
jgi:hypothetical protein